MGSYLLVKISRALVCTILFSKMPLKNREVYTRAYTHSQHQCTESVLSHVMATGRASPTNMCVPSSFLFFVRSVLHILPFFLVFSYVAIHVPLKNPIIQCCTLMHQTFRSLTAYPQALANVLFNRVAALRAVVSYDLGWELMFF